jgi:foldase protein PrsA
MARKTKVIIGIVAIVVIAAAAAIILFSTNAFGFNKAVAATVNGDPIYEQDVTNYIQNIRTQSGYTDDDSWAEALSQSQLDPQSYREQVIKNMEQNVLIKQAAASKGITVDESSVDSQVQQAKNGVGGDDSTWQAALKKYGYASEADFREQLEISNLSSQLMDSMGPVPTDDQLQQYVTANVAQYCQDNNVTDYTVPDDGNIVYDDVPQDVKDALSAQWSDEQMQQYDVANVAKYCQDNNVTDYTVPADGNIVYSDIPQDVLDGLQQQWNTANGQTAYQTYLQRLKDEADLEINDMPSGLPYDVDMSAYESSDSDSSDSSASSSSSSSSSDSSKVYPTSVDEAVSDGLQITDVSVGSGATATSGSTVNVKYVGTLDDGTQFDSNDSFSFTIGSGNVIQGWEWGVQGMQVGGVRDLVIPASLGYGNTATGSIPAGSTLHFEITLNSVS